MYYTNEMLQLFQSTIDNQVILLEVVNGDSFKMFDSTILTEAEMKFCNWEPIDTSSYIGMP